MTYTPGVTVTNGGPYSYEVELIAATLKANPAYSTWDSVFSTSISQGAVNWINDNENPAVLNAPDDAVGPSTSADPQTTVDPVMLQSEENPRPYQS